jgi:hypothetical protein
MPGGSVLVDSPKVGWGNTLGLPPHPQVALAPSRGPHPTKLAIL